LVAGSVHVLAGPDHLAAVAPLAMRGAGRAWLRGAQWGIGHLLGVGVLTSLTWWLRDLLPLEWISGVSEQLVGIVLIAMGLWVLRMALRNRVHAHVHEHDEHTHLHIHAHGSTVPHPSTTAHRHSHVSLWFGVLHGIAGGAHLLAVLPALAFPTRLDAGGYLFGYGLGTVGAMVGFAAILGMVSARAIVASRKLYRTLTATTGVVAVVVGAVWLISSTRYLK
jgi:hypothetical protein